MRDGPYQARQQVVAIASAVHEEARLPLAGGLAISKAAPIALAMTASIHILLNLGDGLWVPTRERIQQLPWTFMRDMRGVRDPASESHVW